MPQESASTEPVPSELESTESASTEPVASQQASTALADDFDLVTHWPTWCQHVQQRQPPASLAELCVVASKHTKCHSPLTWALPNEVGENRLSEVVLRFAPSESGAEFGAGSELQQTESLLVPLPEVSVQLSGLEQGDISNADDSPAAELAQTLALWLEQMHSSLRPTDLQLGWECLLWANLLPELTAEVASEQWKELLELLQKTANDAEIISLETTPLLHLWLAVELPLTLAHLLPELAPHCQHSALSSKLLQSMQQLLDGEGVLHARFWPHFPAIFACWTRCRLLLQTSAPHVAVAGADAAGAEVAVEEEIAEQYHWALRQILSFCRTNSSLSLTSWEATPLDAELLEAATRLIQPTKFTSPSPLDSTLFDPSPLGTTSPEQEFSTSSLAESQAIASHCTGLKKFSRRQLKALPAASVHSEWAELALLRSNWSRKSPRLTVDYHQAVVQLELAVGREVVWSGPWHLDLHWNDSPVTLLAQWQEVCWVDDEDVIYLELENCSASGLKIQRQLLLAKEDGFLFLADAILGETHAEMHYSSRLPLAPKIRMVSASESRETFLEGRKYRALTYPLTLPEWKCDSRRGGKFEQTPEHELRLTLSTAGTHLYAPLWFDLKPKRMLKPCTWRQLTVAETRKIQTSNTAQAFRVQSGKQQWLIYRSLSSAANRTVLGHNLTSEFLLGRFQPDGTVKTLLEIE